MGRPRNFVCEGFGHHFDAIEGRPGHAQCARCGKRTRRARPNVTRIINRRNRKRATQRDANGSPVEG